MQQEKSFHGDMMGASTPQWYLQVFNYIATT